MKIDVSEFYINKGVKLDACLCPVALAIQEELYPDYLVIVGPFSISIFNFDKSDFKTVLIPEHITKWIRDFDIGKEVKPFSFELNVTEAYIE